MLALCNMKTVYIRNMPDDVVQRLEVLARAEGMSVSAYAARTLTDMSAAEANRRAFADIQPIADVAVEEIVEQLHRGRADR